MTVNILGTEYKINKYDYKDKPELKKREICGCCDSIFKEIAYVNMTTYPGYEEETEEFCRIEEKEIIRHEIVHAFFKESGLWNSSYHVDAWATNEEMVDWIALQFPKILKAFQECNCL